MTPEETLDWLAQQHYEQCREVRPIQDWIRKMKTELPEDNTAQAIKAALVGIDQTETESPEGWWETSAGAKFGAKKLAQVLGLIGAHMTWPFPPPTGPTPWTKKQERDYANQQRQQLPEAPI